MLSDADNKLRQIKQRASANAFVNLDAFSQKISGEATNKGQLAQLNSR
jgi:hypothetical protein